MFQEMGHSSPLWATCVFHHPHRKKFFPYLWSESALPSFKTVKAPRPLVPLSPHGAEGGLGARGADLAQALPKDAGRGRQGADHGPGARGPRGAVSQHRRERRAGSREPGAGYQEQGAESREL